MDIFSIVFLAIAFLAALIGLFKGRKYVWQFSALRIAITLVSAVASLFISKAIAKAAVSSVYTMLENDLLPEESKQLLTELPSVPEIFKALVCMILAPILFYFVNFIVKLIIKLFSPLALKPLIKATTKNKEQASSEKKPESAEESSENEESNDEALDKGNKEETVTKAEEEDEEKDEKPTPKKEEPKKKDKKAWYRADDKNPVGAILGIVCALLGVIIFFAPMTGGLAIIGTLEEPAADALAEEDLGEVKVVVETVDAITHGIGVKATNILGGKLLYNGLTTYKVNGTKIRLSNEVELMTTVTSSAMSISDDELTNDAKVDALEEIIPAFEKSSILPIVMAEFLSSAASAWEAGEDFAGIEPPKTEDEMTSELLLDMIGAFKNSTVETVKEDITSVIDVLSILIENDLVENAPEDPMDILGNKTLMTSLLKVFLDNGHLSTIITNVVDLGIEMLGENIGIPKNYDGMYDAFIADIAAINVPENKEEFTKALKNAFNKNGIDITSDSVKSLANAIADTYGTNLTSVPAESIKALLSSVIINTENGTKPINLSNDTDFNANTLLVTTAEIISSEGGEITDTAAEAAALADIFASLSDISSLSADGAENISETLKNLGKILDKFAETETIGKECIDTLIVALLQSDMIKDMVSMNATDAANFANAIIKGTENSNYETVMADIALTLDTLSDISSEEGATSESVEAVLNNLTPETASAMKALVTPEFVENLGVGENSSEAVANVLSNVFGNIATAKGNGMSDEEYEQETAKIAEILDVTMSVTNDSEQREELEVGAYVDSIMESQIMTDTIIDSVYDEDNTVVMDPLNTGMELSDSEKESLEQTLTAKLQESEAAGEDTEETKKLITAIAAYMNTPIIIEGGAVTVDSTPAE